jgi:hypothetical protein
MYKKILLTLALLVLPMFVFANNDGILSITATVINDDGGTKQASDFTFGVTESVTLLPMQGVVPTIEVKSDEKNNFTAGTYITSLYPVSGYVPTTWSGDCTPSGSVVLIVGDNKTCFITFNDSKSYIAPTTSPVTSPSVDPTVSSATQALILQLQTQLVELLKQLLVIMNSL